MLGLILELPGIFADVPTRGHLSRRLVNIWTEWFAD